jgi:hypothetical protein
MTATTAPSTSTNPSPEPLTAPQLQALKIRGISETTAELMGLGTIHVAGQTMLAMPYRKGGTVAYRKTRKTLVSGVKAKCGPTVPAGVEHFPYNIDCLNGVREGDGTRLMICEGEPDVWSAIEAGFTHVISPPDGAGSWRALEPYFDKIASCDEIVLCFDNDKPGRKARNDLAMALVVKFDLAIEAQLSLAHIPDDCGDLNDLLRKHGVEAVQEALNEPLPLHHAEVAPIGLLDDPGPVRTLPCGIRGLDKQERQEGQTRGFPGVINWILPDAPELITVVGPYSSGKSLFAKRLVFNLAKMHNIPVGICAFEEPYQRRILPELMKFDHGAPFINLTDGEKIASRRGTLSRVLRIQRENGFRRDLGWFMDRVEYAGKKYGLKLALLDPWNQADHDQGKGELETQYAERMLRDLSDFKETTGISIMLVAHTSKGIYAQGGGVTPFSLASASGTMAFANKSDRGFCVWRMKESLIPGKQHTVVKVDKLKDEEVMGMTGTWALEYDVHRGEFSVDSRATEILREKANF